MSMGNWALMYLKKFYPNICWTRMYFQVEFCTQNKMTSFIGLLSWFDEIECCSVLLQWKPHYSTRKPDRSKFSSISTILHYTGFNHMTLAFKSQRKLRIWSVIRTKSKYYSIYSRSQSLILITHLLWTHQNQNSVWICKKLLTKRSRIISEQTKFLIPQKINRHGAYIGRLSNDFYKYGTIGPVTCNMIFRQWSR